jgi:hypothetical protein
MGVTKHDRIAKEIAEKKGTEYHSDKGVDIRTPSQVIEVEVDPATFKEGVRQLRGSSKARYLAVPNEHVEDGAVDFENAFHGSKVHRVCVASFSRILDDECAAGEHVLPGDLVSVLVLRVVKFLEERRAQRHMNVVRVAEPVECPFAVFVHALVQRIAL